MLKTHQSKIIEENIPTGIFKLWHNIVLIVSLLGDYSSGKYKITPWKTLSSLTLAMIYVISPIDFIPDFIPVVGILDDLTFLRISIAFCSEDVKKYKIWKDNN